MTIGDRIRELTEEMRPMGATGVFILEHALMALLEVDHYLLTKDHKLLHDTPGYAKLEAADAAVLDRIKALLAQTSQEAAQ